MLLGLALNPSTASAQGNANKFFERLAEGRNYLVISEIKEQIYREPMELWAKKFGVRT